MPRDDAAVIQIVEAMSPDELQRALVAVPHVTAALAGTGPLAGYFDQRGSAAKLTRERIGAHLAHVAARRLTTQQLDPASLRLLSVAVLVGGQLAAADVLTETIDLTDCERERMIGCLVDRVLVRRLDDGGIAIVDGLQGIIGTSGRSVRSLMLNPSVTKHDIAEMLAAHGLTVPPSGKEHCLTLLADVIGDAAHLAEMRALLPPAALELFDAIVAGGAGGVPASSVGLDPWYFQVYDRLPVRQLPPTIQSLMTLDDLGLVWVEPMADRIAAWIEVVRGIQGRLITSWPMPLDPQPVPLDDTTHELPAALSSVHGLLDRVVAEPIIGLKQGGIGVKAVRDLAKRMGRPEREIDLLLAISLATGTIRHHEEILGKGRAATWQHRYSVDEPQVAELRAAGSAALWRTLVDAWVGGTDVRDDRFHHMAMRFQLLHDLLALPDDHGVMDAQFSAWITSQHWLASSIDVHALVAELRVLGLVPTAGPIGLTPLARLLLTDPDRLDDALPDTVATFVVQADHTIVAPPTLDPELRSVLERLTVLHSSGSATVYRLDPAKIGAALADGHTAASILDVLATGSTVGVPPTVSRLVEDIERQRGGLAVLTATTIVTADDVMSLAAAVNVKPAQLTLLAPTVAVSNLPAAKVAAALRAKGLSPSVDAARPDTVVVPARSPDGSAGTHAAVRERTGRREPVRPILGGAIGAAGAAALVETLGDAHGVGDAAAARTGRRNGRFTARSREVPS